MIKGFKILDRNDIRDSLLSYREKGALRGVYLGFPKFNEHYTMSLPGVTDWTGFPGCFTKDQLVITKRGDIPISEVVVGDYVLSYNHEKKINEYRMVTATPVKVTPNRLFKIKMKDGTIIKCTENHLFWTGTSYVKIVDLLLSL